MAFNFARGVAYGTGRRVTGRNLDRGSVESSKSGFARPNGPVREARVHVVFSMADKPQWAQHSLGRVPREWHVVALSRATGSPSVPAAAGTVYSETPIQADKHRISLKCTQAGTTAEIIVR